MKDYLKYVVCVIGKNGEEIHTSVNDKFHKHIQAFKAFDKILKVEEYIKHKGTENITGYDIASFLGASGNIVFFHTDVSNYKINKREASIIIPKDMTDEQKQKLRELCENLNRQNFSYYLTQTWFKNKNYKLVHKSLNVALLKKLVYNVDNRKEVEKCKK